MDISRNDLLSEIAADAALERGDFLVTATEQLRRFLDSNARRIEELGGLTLIDEDPDFLAVSADGTFRSRTRYQDEATGEWVSDIEEIDSPGELVELYNPADIYAAFAEAARVAAGLPPEPTGAEDLRGAAGLSTEETVEEGYQGAADAWAARASDEPAPEDPQEAARLLYDLALSYQERSQQQEAQLLDEFESATGELAAKVGDLMVVDDEDERLTYTTSGRFTAEVVPEEEEGTWRKLITPEELVEFYDPTDIFGDLADTLADAFPGVDADSESGSPDEPTA